MRRPELDAVTGRQPKSLREVAHLVASGADQVPACQIPTQLHREQSDVARITLRGAFDSARGVENSTLVFFIV